MAFDAAATVQAPIQGAAASAKPAARQDDASDPFGALLAMLDGAGADAAPAAPVRTPADVAAGADQSDGPVTAAIDQDAPADETKGTPEPGVSDPATLVAAMMAQAAPSATPTAASPPAQSAAAPTAPAGLDPDPAVIAAPEVPALSADAALETAVPPAAEAAEVAEPIAPSLPTQTAAATPEAASAPIATDDKPADPARADASATEANIGAAPRAGIQGEQDQSSDGGAGDGRPSDAEAQQQARNGNSVPATEAATFTPAAPPAPETPAIGVAQAAAPAPVIAAQAAIAVVRGAPETVAHLAAQMIQRLDGQTTRFDLTLNPQSLGRVDVRIEIGAKGGLRARMAFDDAATAKEMSGRHTELRAALQNAGFDVPEGALSFDVASDGGGAFAERHDADRGATPIFQNFADAADQDPAAIVKNYFSAAGSSGVDIRV